MDYRILWNQSFVGELVFNGEGFVMDRELAVSCGFHKSEMQNMRFVDFESAQMFVGQSLCRNRGGGRLDAFEVK